MPVLALPAAILLMLFGGLFYCWSVFVVPFEAALSAPRGLVSLTFSVGLLALPLGSFIVAPLFRRFSLPQLAAALGLLGAAGLTLAGAVPALATLILGFGVIFGVAVGANYAVALQAVSVPLPLRASLAVSLTTAAFAGAGLVWPKPLALTIERLGPNGTLLVLAGAFGAVSLVSALILWRSGVRAPAALDRDSAGLFGNFLTGQPRVFVCLWLGFAFLGLGGLMAIGHAAGIVQSFGLAPDDAYQGSMSVSLGYIAGCLASGPLCDLFGGPRVLIDIGVLMAVALGALVAFPSALSSVIVMALAGASFGATAAVYPITIPAYYGVSQLARVYGRIMLAYGVAGLLAPYLAGALYDLEGNYTLALMIAAAMAILSVLVNTLLPRLGNSRAAAQAQA